MKKVKYKTKNFGGYADGEKIKVYLVCEDECNNIALLYSPPSPSESECGCLFLARRKVKKNGELGHYYQSDGLHEVYMNMPYPNTCKSFVRFLEDNV